MSLLKSNPKTNEKFIKSIKLTWAKKGVGGPFSGKTHSEDTKNKLKNTFSNINHQSGIKNSQYGKMWIHSLSEKLSTRINVGEEIPNGWIKGRKIKF